MTFGTKAFTFIFNDFSANTNPKMYAGLALFIVFLCISTMCSFRSVELEKLFVSLLFLGNIWNWDMSERVLFSAKGSSNSFYRCTRTFSDLIKSHFPQFPICYSALCRARWQAAHTFFTIIFYSTKLYFYARWPHMPYGGSPPSRTFFSLVHCSRQPHLIALFFLVLWVFFVLFSILFLYGRCTIRNACVCISHSLHSTLSFSDSM